MYGDWLFVYCTLCKTHGEIFRYQSVFLWLISNYYFFNSKYSWKLANDLRHNTVSNIKIGWHFFSLLCRDANIRTLPFYYRLSRSVISIQRNNLQLCKSSSWLKILTQIVLYEKHRTYIEVCFKHKPNYYVQPEYIFIFTAFFSEYLQAVLCAFMGFSVNYLAGVEILVWLLSQIAWQRWPIVGIELYRWVIVIRWLSNASPTLSQPWYQSNELF